MIFLLMLLIILLIFLCIVLVTMTLSVYGWLITSAPFVPVKNHALKYIIDALELQDTSVLCDLGSGEGKVLLAALESNPHVHVRGYEIGPVPRMLSLFRLRKYRHRSKIYNRDLFKAELSDVTHIFLYLYPSVLQKLEPIFDSQLHQGVRVVTCDFTFPNKKPISVIDMPHQGKLAKKLYVYIW
ncbi:hypothetical protein IT403_02465 [Candidatus Nomurabacteria bacterium]|nr:hypothetical protein [Candidatus Nomurabacteria bacterium]